MQRTAAAVILQRAWRQHMVGMMMHIRAWSREMARCVVCGDECVTLFRCEHGHGCCVGCDASTLDQRCPVCREPRHTNPDDTLKTVLLATRARLLCTACNVHVDTRVCEHHRAWCPCYKFTCPMPSCHQTATGADMALHVRHHTDAVEVAREFVLVTNRFSHDIIFVLEEDVFVITTTPRTASSLNDIISGGILFGIRCYYKSPDQGAWTCVVRQIQTSSSHIDDRYVEEYHMGVVPAMIASREQIVVAPYTPHLIPRCVDTSASGGRTPYVLHERGRALTRRLANHGVRDVPWNTRPHRETPLGGTPTCVLRVRLERLSTSVGSIYAD